jgi:hypothetical protein
MLLKYMKRQNAALTNSFFASSEKSIYCLQYPQRRALSRNPTVNYVIEMQFCADSRLLAEIARLARRCSEAERDAKRGLLSDAELSLAEGMRSRLRRLEAEARRRGLCT